MHRIICVSVGKTRSQVDERNRCQLQEAVGRVARRMITGLEKQAGLPKGSGLSTDARLGRTTQALETVAGPLGKTASSKRKCSALWPRCWTDGQEHLGWWPGGQGDRARRKASVY